LHQPAVDADDSEPVLDHTAPDLAPPCGATVSTPEGSVGIASQSQIVIHCNDDLLLGTKIAFGRLDRRVAPVEIWSSPG